MSRYILQTMTRKSRLASSRALFFVSRHCETVRTLVRRSVPFLRLSALPGEVSPCGATLYSAFSLLFGWAGGGFALRGDPLCPRRQSGQNAAGHLRFPVLPFRLAVGSCQSARRDRTTDLTLRLLALPRSVSSRNCVAPLLRAPRRDREATLSPLRRLGWRGGFAARLARDCAG